VPVNRENALCAAIMVWAASLTLFYFVRFSSLFYEAHRGPITALVNAINRAQ